MKLTLNKFYTMTDRNRKMIATAARKHFHTRQVDVVFEHDQWYVVTMRDCKTYCAVLCSTDLTDYIDFEEL